MRESAAVVCGGNEHWCRGVCAVAAAAAPTPMALPMVPPASAALAMVSLRVARAGKCVAPLAAVFVRVRTRER